MRRSQADSPYEKLAASSIWIALGTSIGVMIVITLFFSLLRPYNATVYAPKVRHADQKHAPPEIGKGLFAWVAPVANTKEEELVEKVGLDAAVFLRFTKMCRDIFLFLSIAGCGILMPVHIMTSNVFINGSGSAPQDTDQVVANAFAKMTPQYVQGNPMWSHVACSWVFDAVILYFLWRNYVAVTRLRRQYFESPEYQMSLHSRSLCLTDIPSSDRTDDGILRIADSIEQTPGVPRAAIARNVKELPDLIKEHDRAVRKLESVLAKYLKNPDKLPAKRPTLRPSKKDKRTDQGQQIDAIDYLTERIRRLETRIKEVRESIDKRNAMPYGFATYERIEEAHQVAYAAKNKHPHGVTIRLAPKPNDILWDNLPLSKKVRSGKSWMNSFWIALLTIVWIAPNALIAIFLVNLANLADLWPSFRDNFNGHRTAWAAVQAIAAPALTSLIYLLLPILFRRMAAKSGSLTKTLRERQVTRKLYAFFVFNNLVVFSTFTALWKFVASVIANRDANQDTWAAIQQANLPNAIMVSLCTVSPFWVIWLLQRNLGAAVDLAQIVNLTYIWFARTFMSPTPRQTIEWTAPPPFDYASYYNYFLFYVTVTLCYATLQPLVLPVTFLYFAVDAPLKKYLLLYVFITKTESGGQFWVILFNRILFATGLANCVAALVIKGALGSWIMLGCMAPLPFIIIAFKVYCNYTFDDQCEYYSKASLKDPEILGDLGKKPRRNDRVGVKFGHPALYKPLITPMVHAKAQHVLADIYRGRLNSEAGVANGYSDIAMAPMSQTEPGKAAKYPSDMGGDGVPRDLFEVVPEANLDFAYFKDRADFGDEHGGGGELYGRPLDLVSERSQTPASFMTDDSDGKSRSVSPAPMRLMRQRSDESAQHPAYRSHSDRRGRPVYQMRNDSQGGLLANAQPVGVGGSHGESGRERPELQRWRSGGSGGSGGNGHTAMRQGSFGYQPYRRNFS